MLESRVANLSFRSELYAVYTRPDGERFDLGLLSGHEVSIPKWRQFYNYLRRGRHIPPTLGFAAFLAMALSKDPLGLFTLGIVTTAGIQYMAADFLASSTNPISNFNYHDSGTGTTAVSVSDTGLETPTGIARVAGTQLNPAANQYQSTASITYDGTYAITEWVLMSAASSGTCWDHKRFTAKNVVDQGIMGFTYVLVIIPGG